MLAFLFYVNPTGDPFHSQPHPQQSSLLVCERSEQWRIIWCWAQSSWVYKCLTASPRGTGLVSTCSGCQSLPHLWMSQLYLSPQHSSPSTQSPLQYPSCRQAKRTIDTLSDSNTQSVSSYFSPKRLHRHQENNSSRFLFVLTVLLLPELISSSKPISNNG